MEKLKVEKYSESNKIDYFGEEYATTYTTKYVANISNTYLNKYRTIKAKELYDIEYKISMQFIDWAEKEEIQKEKKNIALSIEQQNELYNTIRENIDNILLYTLDVNDAIDWNSLKDTRTYNLPKPIRKVTQKMKQWERDHNLILQEFPAEPDKLDYIPKLNLIERLIPNKRKKEEDRLLKLYTEAYSHWINECEKIDNSNTIAKKEYEILKMDTQKKYEALDEETINQWNQKKEAFYKKQTEYNTSIDNFHHRYECYDIEAIEEYCELVLNNSQYPDFISKDFELEYNKDNKILIIEYQLPQIDIFPTEKESKYIISRKEIKTSHITQNELNKIYDKALYDTTLRTLHKIFESDVINAIEMISFNGWVNCIDKAIGTTVNNCIISIQVNKKDFLKVNLQNVDPKACFKNFKGISSSKLFAITPIQPIIQITKTDKRFVEAHSVSDKIDNSTNLALMDWEDFEHLIREIFEKEFSSNGGEVKVTQASRDGGVDAIAFDPDPIRGGKIVIQAKRYTNTVGVSAVRDLYGTVMNEGATKGILVTTADFGPDAYDFVKDKPLSLMNGANLLYLLDRHGMHARIDIKEARFLKQ